MTAATEAVLRRSVDPLGWFEPSGLVERTA